MIKLDNIVKTIRSKGPVETKAAVDPGNGKTPEEIEKEILENREAMEAIEAKENVAKGELIEHETKPIKEPVLATCPFCEEEKSAQGMGRHIKAIHEVPGITIQDLDNVEKGLKTLPDLVAEKFEGPATIANLSPEVEKKEFSDWFDVEEDPEDPENNEDPEGIEDPVEATAVEDNPGPPGDPSCVDNPGRNDNPGETSKFEKFLVKFLPPWF